MVFLYILLFLFAAYFLYLLIIIFFPVLKSKKLPFKKSVLELKTPDNRESVSFTVQNDKISAWYYTPGESAPDACIVMSHGFNCTKDCVLEDYALEFVRNGFSVLTYDYRTYGDSEGTPRQLLSITMQQDDLRGAVSYIREKKGIDSIYLWGTSAGATHGLIIAAEDKDIKGVICQCGAYDHKLDSQKGIDENGYLFYISLLPHGIRDKWRGKLGLSRHTIPAYGKSDSICFLRSDAVFEGAERLGIHSRNFLNEVCAAFMLQPHGPNLLEVSERIECPVLLQVCENDEIVSNESHLKLSRILGNKVKVDKFPISHFDIYQGEWFEKAIKSQIDFLNS